MWFYVIEFGSLPLLEQQARFWLWMVTVYYRAVLLVIVKLLGEYPLVLGTCWCSFYLFMYLFFSCKIFITDTFTHTQILLVWEHTDVVLKEDGCKRDFLGGWQDVPFSALITC